MKLISYSLWGSNPLYTSGMIDNLLIAKRVYPGWVVRVYHDDTVPEPVIATLKSEGAETVWIPTIRGAWDGLFWRFYPLDDPKVTAFIVRDADSRLTTRERNAVEDFMDSPYHIHTMRDHWNHNVPMLGGMWGMKTGVITGLLAYLKEWSKFEHKGTDQTFLHDILWPQFRHLVLAHDRYPNGFFRLPDKTFRFPSEIAEHNKNDGLGTGDRKFPRGRITLKTGEEFQRLDVYTYDPIDMFGPHAIRPFPPGALEYGHFIGEPTTDYDRPYDSVIEDYI